MACSGRLNSAARSRAAGARPTPLEMTWPTGPAGLSQTGAQPEADWLVFRGDELLVEMGPTVAPSDDLRVKARPAWAKLPLQKNHNWLGSGAARTLYLGRLAGMQCWAAELPGGAEAPAGMAWAGVRSLFTVLDDAQVALAGRALQLIALDCTPQDCGRCGTPPVAQAA